MNNTIKTKEFNSPQELISSLAIKKGIDLSEVLVIYAGNSIKGIYKSVIKTAQDAKINVIAFASKDTLIAGPSIDKILSILKRKK